MLGPWKTFLKLIKFKLTKVCNQINFTVGFCDEIEETFFAINKVQTSKGLQSDQFYSWFLWWNWRNIFAINKVQTSKGLQSDQFCSLFLWYTIWTWKNICHALWSWKSVSLIISLDGLVWTWHNYKYLSIDYYTTVVCTMYLLPPKLSNM